jgi:hypothetical protein
MKTQEVLHGITAAGGKLKVKSALNPMLWLCAIIGAPCFLIILLKDNPPIQIYYILFSLIGITLFGFLFLLIFDRDKLQSESYQLEKRRLELLTQEKGDPLPHYVDAEFEEIEGELPPLPSNNENDKREV